VKSKEVFVESAFQLSKMAGYITQNVADSILFDKKWSKEK
jgi:hypothetical protein